MRVFSGQPQVPQHPAAIIREIHLVLAFPPDRSKVPGTNASLPSAVHQRSRLLPGILGSHAKTQRRKGRRRDEGLSPRIFEGWIDDCRVMIVDF